MKNVKIKTRLLLSFSLMILLSLIIALTGLVGISGANSRLQEFAQKQSLADDAVKMCRIEADNAARIIRDMYIDPDTSHDADYEAAITRSIAALERQLAVLKESYTESDGLAENYEEAVNVWSAIGLRAVDSLKRGDQEGAQTILLEECSPALASMLDDAKALTESTGRMKEELLQRNLAATTMAAYLILAVLAVSAACGIRIAMKVTAGIVTPIHEVEAAAQGMAQGVLSARITYQSKDAVGRMADNMRRSLETLSGYIRDIDRAMGEMADGNFDVQPSQPFIGEFKHIEDSITAFIGNISETLVEIRQAADQVSIGASQVSAGSQELALGATEQASAVQELAATLEDISESVRKNAKSSKQVSRFVEETGEALSNSNEQMRQMIQAMGEISASSDKIGKIIKTIEDIAFQTNILALNAAVEAARAGAAGKGFAVVADEVRSLAGKSAEASRNTSALIEESLQAVRRGTQIADATAASLLTVVDSARQVTDQVSLISAQSETQARSIVQVTQGIEQISGVVQTNSATAEESAAASEELSGQARMLKSLVSRFRVREETGAARSVTRPVCRCDAEGQSGL